MIPFAQLNLSNVFYMVKYRVKKMSNLKQNFTIVYAPSIYFMHHRHI